MGGMQAAPGAQWNTQPMMGNPMNANMQGQMPFRPMMAPMTAMNAGPFATPGQPTNVPNQFILSLLLYWGILFL